MIRFPDALPALDCTLDEQGEPTLICPSCDKPGLRSWECKNGNIGAKCANGCSFVEVCGGIRDRLYRTDFTEDDDRCSTCGFVLDDGPCPQADCAGNVGREHCGICYMLLARADGKCINQVCSEYEGESPFVPYEGNEDAILEDLRDFADGDGPIRFADVTDELVPEMQIEITRTPNEKGWYKGVCPKCEGDDFSFKKGRGGTLIVHCFDGCSDKAVYDALRWNEPEGGRRCFTTVTTWRQKTTG